MPRTVESTVQTPTHARQDPWDVCAELQPGGAAARMAAARRRGEPAWLWPEVDPASWRASLRRLEAVVSAVARGARPALDAGGDVRALGVAAYTSGLGPWLGRQVERGEVLAGDDVAHCLAVHLDHSRRRWHRLERVVGETASVLEASGARPVVLKGAHTARSYFEEAALRPMADVDVLVAGARVAVAERALAANGCTELRGRRLRRPYRSEWVMPGAPRELRSLMFCHADDPHGIDLHGSADIDFFGVATVGFDAVLAAHADATGVHHGVRVLSQPYLAAHLAVHAGHGLHGLTLIRLLELALVLRSDLRTAADWGALRDVLRELDAERFAFPALALTERLVPGTVQASLLEACTAAAPARLRRIVGGLEPHAAQRLHGVALDERFMWCDGLREHARRAAHMLLPRSGPRRLGAIYAARAWRLVRGSVAWRGG